MTRSMCYPEYSATTFNAHDHLGVFGSIPVSFNVALIASYIVSNLTASVFYRVKASEPGPATADTGT